MKFIWRIIDESPIIYFHIRSKWHLYGLVIGDNCEARFVCCLHNAKLPSWKRWELSSLPRVLLKGSGRCLAQVEVILNMLRSCLEEELSLRGDLYWGSYTSWRFEFFKFPEGMLSPPPQETSFHVAISLFFCACKKLAISFALWREFGFFRPGTRTTSPRQVRRLTPVYSCPPSKTGKRIENCSIVSHYTVVKKDNLIERRPEWKSIFPCAS